MKTAFISLGSGCEPATMIKKFGLRKESYFFDWFWNFDAGMPVVADMIRTDFKKIISEDVYVKAKHDWFADEVVVYKDYPAMVHMHIHPLDNQQEHEKLIRRADRFLGILRDPDVFVNFLYQRTYNSLKFRESAIGSAEAFNKLKLEGEEFVACLKEKYPDKKFNLILVLSAEPADYEQIVKDVDFNSFNNDNIKYCCTIASHDDFLQNACLDGQWREIIFKKCKISLFGRLMAGLRYEFVMLSKKIIYYIFRRDIPWHKPWKNV